MSFVRRIMRSLKTVWPILLSVTLLSLALAPAGFSATISDIATNTSNTMKSVAQLLEAVSLIAGIGFVMASFFKFHQHKLNPQQVPISQGITLLIIGGGLTMFPALLPVGGKAIAGGSATFGSLSDTDGAAILKQVKNS